MSCWKCTWLPVAALISLVVVTSSAQQFYASSRYGKRAESAVVPRAGGTSAGFQSGSRFGRNQAPRDEVQVVPRTDRFYMGSRYGKRSDIDAVSDAEINPDTAIKGMMTTEDDMKMICVYSGITNLYRCFPRKDNASEEASSNK